MRRVVLDARDAHGVPLRGWGRHVLELERHLPAALGPDLDLHPVTEAGGGPEVLFEQLVLPRVLRRTGAALVHAPNCFLPLRRPCPGVVTVHDLAFEAHPEDFSRRTGAKYRFITPRAVRSAQAVICVSEFTAGDVVDRYGADPATLHVVPNAPSLPVGDGPAGLVAAGVADPGAGRPASGDADPPYLLAIGDLRAKKNLGRLVQAWDRLREEPGGAHGDLRLVLAGTGDAGELAQRRGTATPLMPGYLDDAALDALLRGAAALVHPSLYEGYGLVLVEAMARGVPVVCADATALPETAGGAAVLVDPHDPDAIAAGVAEALTRREELVLSGRTRAAEFSWERTARETVAVYREVLGG